MRRGERNADRISLVEIEEASMHYDPQMIEVYPDDPRGHSFLLLGFSGGETNSCLVFNP